MSRIFYNSKRQKTDILHSEEFNRMTFAQRQKFAFNKQELDKLNKTDKLLMRGYAQSISERQKAYNYNHSFNSAVKKGKTRKINVKIGSRSKKIKNY